MLLPGQLHPRAAKMVGSGVRLEVTSLLAGVCVFQHVSVWFLL